MRFKLSLLVCLLFAFHTAFAQSELRMSVYTTGNMGANEKKALSTKMLSSFVNSGKYRAIENSEAFINGLQNYEKTKALENSQTIAFAKQFGAQFVCLINIIPVFNSYHVSASIINTETSAVVGLGEAGSDLKSLEDLTNVTNALSAQLLQAAVPAATPAPAAVPALAVPALAAPIAPATPGLATTALAAPDLAAPALATPPATAPVAAVTPAAAAPQQCGTKFNINEMLFKVSNGFPTQLKDCGTSFAKETLMAKSPFAKKAAPEPKSFMTQCTIDGLKSNLPADFPGVDKILGDIQGFINNILNTAMAGASLDPQKLMSAIGDMKIDELLGSIKNLAAGNECIVDEPYVPPVAAVTEKTEEKAATGEDAQYGKGLGFQARMNINSFSSGNSRFDKYVDIGLGFGGGLAFKIPINSVLAFNTGLGIYYRELYNVAYEERAYGYGGYEYIYRYEETLAEFAFSIPIALQFGNRFYGIAGLQLEIPVWSKLSGEDNGEEFYKDLNNRSIPDLGIALGTGFYITKRFAVDFKAVIGLLSLTDKSRDKSSYNQYGIGITFF